MVRPGAVAIHTPASAATMPTAVAGPAASCNTATASTVAATGSNIVRITVSPRLSVASPVDHSR
jgi:hypothetical protein